MEFEEHFEISIPNEDTAEFLSLKTAVDYITAKKAEHSKGTYGS
jgi:acyl carrier protein